MTHNSKKKLDSEVAERLGIQLAKIFNQAGQKELATLLVEDFFTNSEKIMLSKRLGAILLLNKTVPQHVICERLKMSPSTVAKLSSGLESGKYGGILKAVKRQDGFFDVFLEILLETLPRPFGRYRNSIGSIYKSSPEFDPKFHLNRRKLRE